MFLDLRLGLGTRVSTALAQALIDYKGWSTKTVTSEYVTDGVELELDFPLNYSSGDVDIIVGENLGLNITEAPTMFLRI